MLSDLLKSRTFWTILMTAILDTAGILLAAYVKDPVVLQLATVWVGCITGLGGIALIKFTVDDREKALTARAQLENLWYSKAHDVDSLLERVIQLEHKTE